MEFAEYCSLFVCCVCKMQCMFLTKLLPFLLVLPQSGFVFHKYLEVIFNYMIFSGKEY